MFTLPAGPTESMRWATKSDARPSLSLSLSLSCSLSLSPSLSLSLLCLCLCFPFLFSFSFLFLLSFTAVLFTALPCYALISFGEPPHMKKAEHLGALGLRGETSWVHSAYLPPPQLTVTTEELGRSTCIHHGHARPCDALLFLCRPLEEWRTLRCPRLGEGSMVLSR